MQTCEMSCIKFMLFAFNCLFTLSGISLLVVGGLMLRDGDRFKAFLNSTILAPPIILLIVGVIVFVIAFLGCCGAIKEHPPMLLAFAGLLFIVFIAEITVGVLSAMHKEIFVKEMRKIMKASKDNYNPKLPEDKALWDELQSKLECCGVDGPSDWQMGGVYPASCCRGYNPQRHKDHLCGPFEEYLHPIGCFDKLRLKIFKGAHIALGVGIGLAVVQFSGIVLGCVLASSIKGERKGVRP